MKTNIISRLISVIFVLTLILIACNREDNKVDTNNSLKKESTSANILARVSNDKVNDFLNSQTFLRHENFISSYGNINEDSIHYKQISIYEFTTDYFIIPLYDGNGNEIGTVEAVKIDNSQFLPNRDAFVMNLTDRSEYNVETKTGVIEMYDINYDYFKHSFARAENGEVIELIANGLSEDLKAKYASIQNPNKQANLSKRHLCDSNGNGNISFSECSGCIKRAIQQNSFSTAVCVGAWYFGPWYSACDVPTAIACAYISSVM